MDRSWYVTNDAYKKYERLPQVNFRGAKKIECWLRMLQAEKEFM